MNKNFLENTKRIHFIGIGGSGMSPIAEILHHKGYSITGSDRAVSDTLERVRILGDPGFDGTPCRQRGRSRSGSLQRGRPQG